MTEEMKNDIADVAVSSIENSLSPSFNAENACRLVKEALDKKFGPSW